MAGRGRRAAELLALLVGIAALVAVWTLLRFADAVVYREPSAFKDPQREVPPGDVIVSPADGTVLYVRRIEDGTIPMVVKRGVPVPVVDHTRLALERPFRSGYLIGIYMHTLGVHVNRVPSDGRVAQQFIYAGPQMDMTEAETTVGISGALPGFTFFKKLLGMDPYNLEGRADFVLKSARETLVIEEKRGTRMLIVRIADFYVGRILTWIEVGQDVARGDKIGMITFGSQTDLFIEDSPGLTIEVAAGEYIYGAETIVATY